MRYGFLALRVGASYFFLSFFLSFFLVSFDQNVEVPLTPVDGGAELQSVCEHRACVRADGCGLCIDNSTCTTQHLQTPRAFARIPTRMADVSSGTWSRLFAALVHPREHLALAPPSARQAGLLCVVAFARRPHRRRHPRPPPRGAGHTPPPPDNNDRAFGFGCPGNATVVVVVVVVVWVDCCAHPTSGGA